MDERIRISDADRDRVIGRLNHHFAEGRLTQEELDERVSAALNAKTFGDIRGVMADLPEPVPVPPRAAGAGPAGPGPAGPPPWAFRRRGPRILPLVALALLLVLLVGPGSVLVFAFFKALIVIWLVACLAGIIAAGRVRRRMRQYRGPGYARGGYQRGGWDRCCR